MATPNEQIKLTGSRADRFREIRKEMKESCGYTPPNTEVLGRLMEEWDQ